MSKKTIRVLVEVMVVLETDLEANEAVKDFEQNSNYEFRNTDNVEVIGTEWRQTLKVSSLQYGKDNRSFILKPLKNETNRNTANLSGEGGADSKTQQNS